MNKVAFILINYNSSQFTLACVASIRKNTAAELPIEIIVVDNNSEPADFRQLLDGLASQNVRIVRSRINLGFSGGNMFGVQHADAQYFYFLNNDCELMNDNASILSSFMDRTPNAGICSGQMHKSDGSLANSFGYFPSLKFNLLGSALMHKLSPENFPLRRREYAQPVKVPLVSGSALFVDSAKFSEVSGFDTNFFLYCEEEDLAACMRAKNHFCYFVPEAKFVHHMGKSTERSFGIEREYYISLMYYLRKHHTSIEYSLLRLFYFFKAIKKLRKGGKYLRLALLILKGAPMRDSMRFIQKLGPIFKY